MLKRELLNKKVNYNLIKRGMAILQMCSVIGGCTQVVYADNQALNENSYNIETNKQENLVIQSDEIAITEQIESDYINSVEKYYTEGKILDISIEEYAELYNSEELYRLEEYVKEYESVKAFENQISLASAYASTYSSSSGSDEYYYNTGTSMPKECDYSKYDLLDVIKKGDMIYESYGFYSVAGHSIIVEGKFYSAEQKRYYIRVVEAIGDGVCRGIYDDTRMDERNGFIKRSISATSKQKNAAVDFAISQLGKKYYLDFQKDTSADEKDWYCSELVWAAYMNQGINLENIVICNEPGVTPRDLYYSTTMEFISKYK